MSGFKSSARDAGLASPEPLSFTVHSPPVLDAANADQRRTAGGRIRMLLILLACAAPVLASYFTYYVIRPEGRTNHGTLIEPSRALPTAAALPLHDLQGRAVDPATLRGQWLLVVVADAGCDAGCERLLYAQRQLREMLGKDKDRLDRVWFVTGTRPLRADLLPALSQATLLRTDAAALSGWLQPQDGQPLGAHLYLVDPHGQWMMRFPPDFEPARVRRDLERLMRASASWDLPGR